MDSLVLLRLAQQSGVLTTADALGAGCAIGTSPHSCGGLHPEPQARIWDDDELVARVDFLFREARVVVEFDGDVKYAAADGRVALVREKRREDRLRRLGFSVVRLCWRDLDDPARVVAVVRAALAAAPAPFVQDQYGSR